MRRDPRWQRIDEIYQAARGRDAAERDAFLRTACGGDQDLRREVEALLADGDPEEFFTSPALELAARERAESGDALIGRTLGHYRVLAFLGAGGMGRVYRARDTTLQRDVAIKVLPEALAHDPSSAARFAREARLLAALNHPRIAAIHEFVQTDGVSALALELVDGDTLAERLASGPLGTADTIRIAGQIAEGLAAAHDRGIVHRDLKPSNIKLRPDGTVKILDFGLAKALATAPDESDPRASHASTATRVGVVTGTPAYMSPEQAQGLPVDRRTDVWSFGCVMYEMLTRTPAFSGDGLTATLAAVMTAEPNWNALPRDLPAALRPFLRRCLAKDATQRVGDIHTMRLALDGAFDTDDAPASRHAAAARSRSRLLMLATGAAVLLLTSIVALWVWRRGDTAELVTRSTQFEVSLPATQILVGNEAHNLDVSPNGTVVYAANLALWLRPLAVLTATVVPGTENSEAHTPTFSPDGRWIAYYAAASRQLQRVALGGGKPFPIATVDRPFGVYWSASDRILYGRGADGIWEVSIEDGTPRRVIAVADGEEAHNPRLLPDGRVLYTLKRRGAATWDEAQIVAQARNETAPTVLVPQGRDARYLPTGHLLYASGNELVVVRFDAGRAASAPVSQLRDVRSSYLPFTSASQYAVGNETLAYIRLEERSPLDVVWVSRDGQEVALGLDVSTGGVRIAPDGTRILNEGTGPLRVSETARPHWDPLVRGLAHFGATWSADSQEIVFNQGDSIIRARADGTNPVELLTFPGNQLLVPGAWSRDRRYVTYTYGTQNSPRIGLLDLAGPIPATPPATPFIDGASSASLAPGGDAIAYQSRRSGEYHIYVDRFPRVGAPTPVSAATGGGSNPVWSGAGGELFYRRRDGAVMVVNIETSPVLKIAQPKMVFANQGYVFLWGAARGWDVTSDGKRFLLLKNPAPRGADTIVVVENWLDELKRQTTR